MPSRIPRPCNKSGCPELTIERYCPEHKQQIKQQTYEKRGKTSALGYGSRWTKYSKVYRKHNPFCVKCRDKGDLTMSDHVDHIIAVTGPDDPLFWKADNHQALCHRCHNIKTRVEDKRGYGSRG